MNNLYNVSNSESIILEVPDQNNIIDSCHIYNTN